jgi:hypothetical protein
MAGKAGKGVKLSDGTPYASDEEVYFSWFLEELKEAGFIKEYRYEQRVMDLFEGLNGQYIKYLKTKERMETFRMLTKRVYTPDFEIVWEPKAEGIFYNELECMLPADKRAYFVAQNGVTLVEIKPPFDMANMTRHVKALIDWTWQRFNIFVQLVIPVPRISKGKCSPADAQYTVTCIPKRYLRSDGGGKMRKINFKYRLLAEFIEDRGKVWEEIKKSVA